jgi:glycosyltransferase involved in cell wall biosynthesis
VHGSSIIGRQIKESRLLNEQFECRYINLGTSKSIDEIGKNPFGKTHIYLNILFSTIKNLLFFKPDLCYIAITAKGVAFYKDAIIAIIVKLFGVKVVYHFHNKGVSNYQDKFWYNLFYRLVFNNSRVILLSKYLYYDIKKYVPESSVYYCPNGIPDSIHERKYIKKNNDVIRLLFLSNLIESKGVFVLLDACKILKDRNLQFECVFIGAESEISKNTIEQKINNLDLNSIVQYVGSKNGYEKHNYLENADIFILPTYYHYECFPLVVLEAMQFSLPVIATFEGGIPDMVIDGETGFLCKQKDAECLADKIEILIKDPELRKKMGNAGRIRYEEYFTLEHFEKIIITILNDYVICNKFL